MKAVIYMFSGTGNTKKVTEEFGKNLSERGVEAKIIDVESKTVEKDVDLIGIAYPIHAFSAPENVIKKKILVPVMRIERMTSPLPRGCSTTEPHGHACEFVERVKGIEPSS